MFSLNSLGMIAMGQINARLLRHYTPEQIIGYARPATLVMAALLAGSALTGIGGMWGVLVPLFFIIGSFGFFGANATAAGLAWGSGVRGGGGAHCRWPQGMSPVGE